MTRCWTRTRVSGPLTPYVAGFVQALTGQGYSEWTVPKLVKLAATLSGWLLEQRREVGDLSPALLREFVTARRDAGWRTRSARSFGPLLAYLQTIGVVAEPDPPQANTPVEVLVESYRTYLLRERGVRADSAMRCTATARALLSSPWGTGHRDLASWSARDITALVVVECRRRTPGAARHWVCELRSLLRFLEVEGRTPPRLLQAIPRVAHWSGASLPRALHPAEVERLLNGCDRGTVEGIRDFAVITLLVRLGLRSLEVSQLTLEDIDWRHGELVVDAKGRCEQLPLPSDVGAALSAYLHRRPRVRSRRVFVAVRAPLGGLKANSVSFIVRRACRRADVPPSGAHRLRHTAATEMLRRGASLAEVGQVLRHQSPQTTAIYAKVDRASLHELARDWPGTTP